RRHVVPDARVYKLGIARRGIGRQPRWEQAECQQQAGKPENRNLFHELQLETISVYSTKEISHELNEFNEWARSRFIYRAHSLNSFNSWLISLVPGLLLQNRH